ncbi:MAG: fold metallo-hydrolase [Dehalococcoidia bacterium]|nr:fold metallo-hydrolase [Dehalococcoidia bacterium]
MFLKQFVNEGLGNSSYLLGSLETGEAAVIDPQRDVDIYVKEARKAGLRIQYALETHLHADFVSGSRELAAATGASIGVSAQAHVAFPHIPLKEGDRLELGEVTLEVLATPGHSPEHISFLVYERGKKKPSAVFSGGALTVGGIARTDLLGHEHAVPLARQAYHTLHDKILKLSSSVQVYPTHGGGSYCVATQTEKRITSIGQERRNNRLLKATSAGQFVKLAMEGLPAYPTYFKWMRPINQKGPPVLGHLPELVSLLPPDAKQKMEHGALVIDVRTILDFARGHIPGAYNIVLRDAFSSWLGWVVPPKHPLVFVTAVRQSREEIVRQCIRIGYDDLAGYLEGGMLAWRASGYPIATSGLTTPEAVSEKIASKKEVTVLDVREEEEWRDGHVPNAIHIPLGELESRISEIPRTCPVSVTCSHGVRASTGVSMLQRHGFQEVENIVGGYHQKVWK